MFGISPRSQGNGTYSFCSQLIHRTSSKNYPPKPDFTLEAQPPNEFQW